MKRLAIAMLALGCGGPATPPVGPSANPDGAATPTTKRGKPPRDHAPIDPIAVLAPVADAEISWLVPGRVQLELDGAGIEAPGGNRPIEVTIVERIGTRVRAVVRLPHARFSLWTDASRMLAVITREQRVNTYPGANPLADKFVVLRPGARVRKLERLPKERRTKVRYVGALEVEGWVPDDILAEAWPARDRFGRVPSGRRPLMVLPGSIIRVEPKWGAGELALVGNGNLLDTVKEVDSAWVEVAYADGDVSLRGFVSRNAPPGRSHRTRDPEVPPPTTTPNAKVASGTCLYARPGGEAIGYIVGEQDVHLEDTGNGAWTIAFDTPWGAIPFSARGPTQTSLAACAPAGSVPVAPATSP